MPVLPHRWESLARLLAELLEPVEEIGGADVFHRVQAETVHAGGLQVPLSPAVQILNHLGGAHIQASPHQVVVVAQFSVHLPIPFLALELVDGGDSVLAVPVNPVKAGPVPLEVGVLPLPAWEGKSSPGGDGFGQRGSFGSGRTRLRCWPGSPHTRPPPCGG